MPKYIDIEKIQYKTLMYPTINFATGTVYTERLDGEYAERKDIEVLTTVDVQEVRHGEWISRGDCGVTMCSNCKYNFNGCLPEPYYKYCPMCGAEMEVKNSAIL